MVHFPSCMLLSSKHKAVLRLTADRWLPRRPYRWPDVSVLGNIRIWQLSHAPARYRPTATALTQLNNDADER